CFLCDVVRTVLFAVFSFFFFFQAEDGIRDKLVTGVQTCALPIFGRAQQRHLAAARRRRRTGSGARWRCWARPSRWWRTSTTWRRSEERRVGKECRSRGAPDD